MTPGTEPVCRNATDCGMFRGTIAGKFSSLKNSDEKGRGCSTSTIIQSKSAIIQSKKAPNSGTIDVVSGCARFAYGGKHLPHRVLPMLSKPGYL
jgi:hypothetical protein